MQSLFEDFVQQLAQDYNLNLNKLSEDEDALKFIADRFQPTEFRPINLVLLSNGNKLPFQIIASGAPVGEGTDIAI